MKYSTLIITIFAAALLTACTLNTATNANSNSNTASSVNANANAEATPDALPESAGAQSQAAAAEALVADLYKQHDAKKSPFFQTKNRALVDKYFTKPTADLIWKDATSSAGEVGALDGDPLYAAQDTDIKNFAVGRATVKGDSAVVPVTFTNFGEKRTVTFTLKLVKNTWKIDDIKWPEGDSMVKVITEQYSGKNNAPSAAGEFAGKFQVGETTCAVTPVKMAFEIRWEKGKGSEMFFYQADNTFESEPGKDGAINKFVFDDENYQAGTFYRADGKTFPVKRAN